MTKKITTLVIDPYRVSLFLCEWGIEDHKEFLQPALDKNQTLINFEVSRVTRTPVAQWVETV